MSFETTKVTISAGSLILRVGLGGGLVMLLSWLLHAWWPAIPEMSYWMAAGAVGLVCLIIMVFGAEFKVTLRNDRG